MNHTFRQRSALIMEVERRERQHNRGDYIVAGVSFIVCIVFVFLAAMGVV